MIAPWMLYALAVGGLVTIAAFALDRALATRGRATRGVWSAALALSILIPSLGGIARQVFVLSHGRQVVPFTITVVAPQAIVSTDDATRRAVIVNRVLLGLWLGASALLLLRLARATRSLERLRRDWHPGEVDGVPVQLSSDVGPAVIGLRSMHLVLPEWILALDTPHRALVLRHEQEHRAARDPYLLFGSAVAVALMPWNPALWIQSERLRLAIEMDCDARVLRAHPTPERYGLLMLTIAQRRSIAPTLVAPMLSEPTTHLERRIVAMRSAKPRLTRLGTYAATGLSTTLLLLAGLLRCAEPVTTPPRARTNASFPSDEARLRGDAGRGPQIVSSNQTFFEFQVEQQVSPMPGNPSPRYPDLLREANVEGEVLAQFVVDTLGRPIMDTFKVLKSTHDLFTNSVRLSLPNMTFHAAEVGGKKVKQLVQMPFQFSLSRR
jgi:beta-lactamase regulating signal transducer with metallopeptidase domain